MAVEALPFNAAVIVLALKLPEASRATIVDAPFEDEADVRALSKVPELMFEALILVIEAPEPLNVAEITFAEKLPEASLATIVEAPLDELAEVLALSKVPELMAEAFKLVSDAPEPLNVAEIVLALKLPEASRATIVLAPLADAAVV